jgi:DNA uptake protein ComE-like DNA-binding protein
MKSKILFSLYTFLAFVLLVCLSPAQSSTSTQTQTTTTTTKTKKSAGEAKSSKESSKIDINSATKDELATLPGIGDVTAQKIIDNRPYRAKNELVTKKVVSKAEYAKIKDQIIAHHKKPS